MSQQRKPFKQPPKRFHPKWMTILHEDHDILVIDKKHGLLTMGNDKVRENTAYYLLNEYVRKGNSKSKNQVLIVHRLDRDTSGLLVFAKHHKAQKTLQDDWQTYTKTYTAIVHGNMPEEQGSIRSYLTENKAMKMYSTQDEKAGKLSITNYKVLSQAGDLSWLQVSLETGRKNQIRVHLAEAGCPILGDGKYGERAADARRLYLHAERLTFRHPHNGEELSFHAPVPKGFNARMR